MADRMVGVRAKSAGKHSLDLSGMYKTKKKNCVLNNNYH